MGKYVFYKIMMKHEVMLEALMRTVNVTDCLKFVTVTFEGKQHIKLQVRYVTDS